MIIGFMPLPMGGPTNEFYESWADYLQPFPTIFLKMVALLGQAVAVLLYNLGSAVLDAWNGAWKLVDFSALFTSKHADNMTGFQLTQYIGIFFMIGIIIMSIMMAIQLMQFTMTSGRRGKEWPGGIVTALMVIWIVPMLISGGTSVAKAMNERMLGAGTQQNVLTKVWRSNTVDLTKLANANFDTHGGNPNQYSPVTDTSSNNIVKTTLFTEVLDDDALKSLIHDRNPRKVFENKFGNNTIASLDKGSFLAKSAATEVYPRVKVNWFGIIAAELVFSVVGFMAITELLVRIYRLAYYSLTLLVFAFRDMQGKKAMQILHVMEGSIIGVALLPLNLLMFFGFVQWGMNTIGNSDLGWAPYTILIIALMVAGMKGLLGGFALIDDWTGVPTGAGASMMNMVGAATTALTAARGVSGTARVAGHTAKFAGRNMQAMVAKAAENAAALREKVQQAGNTTGVLPNIPMPDKSAIVAAKSFDETPDGVENMPQYEDSNAPNKDARHALNPTETMDRQQTWSQADIGSNENAVNENKGRHFENVSNGLQGLTPTAAMHNHHAQMNLDGGTKKPDSNGSQMHTIPASGESQELNLSEAIGRRQTQPQETLNPSIPKALGPQQQSQSDSTGTSQGLDLTKAMTHQQVQSQVNAEPNVQSKSVIHSPSAIGEPVEAIAQGSQVVPTSTRPSTQQTEMASEASRPAVTTPRSNPNIAPQSSARESDITRPSESHEKYSSAAYNTENWEKTKEYVLSLATRKRGNHRN